MTQKPRGEMAERQFVIVELCQKFCLSLQPNTSPQIFPKIVHFFSYFREEFPEKKKKSEISC